MSGAGGRATGWSWEMGHEGDESGSEVLAVAAAASGHVMEGAEVGMA